jgi:hypothetical protein
MIQWSEILPEQCPPENAIDPNGMVFYRLCESAPIENDFKSQKAICPTGVYKNVSECIARSLSVWDDIDKCLNILKLPRHKGKSAMILELKSHDGLVLQTFKPNHYSWWRTQLFGIKYKTCGARFIKQIILRF